MIVTFIHRAILQGIPLIFGSTGEIITEKSGHLNLGIPGIMYVGSISGVIGAFFYEQSLAQPSDANALLAIMIPLLACILGSALMGLLYCFLTVTLRANQNVTGLAMTTFGVGLGNFFGGSLIRLAGADVPSVALSTTSLYFSKTLPIADKCGWFGEIFLSCIIRLTGADVPSVALSTTSLYFPKTLPIADKCSWFGEIFLSYSFLAYLAIIISLVCAFVLNRTRVGLKLRAVGENPATADAAGINVTRYKYVATIVGSVIAGLGGLYYVMDYQSGIWSNNAFGDRGWLAIALVIFVIWKPSISILGSILFGALLIVHNYLGLNMEAQELFKAIPYVVTLVVLIITSMRKKREYQPPASLGLNYFREER